MAKSTKTSNAVLLLVGGVAALGALLFWPKKAAAAPSGTKGGGGGGFTGPKPTITILAQGKGMPSSAIQGTDGFTLQLDAAHPFPTFTAKSLAQGHVAVYLEAYSMSGTPVFTPECTAKSPTPDCTEPPVADLFDTAVAKAADLALLIADVPSPFDDYYATGRLKLITDAGGHVLIWTANASTGDVIAWWLTKWS